MPAATGSATGGTTWNNQALDPGLISASSPAIASHNVSVVAVTGAAEASIDLPSFNPNVPALSLVYNSLSANATPIIVGEYALSAVRSQVSAQLTFNGTAGSTYYYDTSALRPGDILQIGQQANAASLATGRYSYSLAITESRGGHHDLAAAPRP